MNIEHLYHDLIAKKLSKNATADEQKQLAAWLKERPEHQQIYEETAELWKLSQGYKDTPLVVNTASAWDKLEGQLDAQNPPQSNQPPSHRVVKMRPWRMVASMAAAVTVLVASWFYFQNTPSNIDAPDLIFATTTANEKQEVKLPDGSRIWLNANSKLSYATAFTDRNVSLEGEAFFEVERDEKRPFTITAGGAKTTVLGTSFNIRAYPEEAETEVTVQTGSVEVAPLAVAKTTQPILLTAGLSGVYKKEKQQIEQRAAPVSNALAWQNKRLEFDYTPMSEVEIALERYFNIDIELSNQALLNCDFDGTYNDPKLEEILEILQYSLEAEIKKENKIYRLSGEGCD